MKPQGTKIPAAAKGSTLPWLHFGSTVPLFLILSLFAAVYSELGRHIAPGESPAFAWVRGHVGLGLGLTLSGRMLVAAFQIGRLRHSKTHLALGLRLSVGTELLCMAAIMGVAYFESGDELPLIATLYLLVVLAQGVGALVQGGFPEKLRGAAAGIHPCGPTPWWYGGLFLLGGLTAVIEPSWRRMADQTVMDTALEAALHLALPAWIGGVATLWIGIGLAGGAFLFTRLQRRMGNTSVGATLLLMGTLVFIPGLFSALLLAALMHAVSWQATALNLSLAWIQLLSIVTVAGSAFLAHVFLRLDQRWPKIRESDQLAVMCLTLGAALVWPLTLLMTSNNLGRMQLRTLAGLVSTTCLVGMMVVLFGNLFNPWYTAFSYLKWNLVTLLGLVAAGSGTLMMGRRGILHRN
jgi:hypothetical protein